MTCNCCRKYSAFQLMCQKIISLLRLQFRR